MNTPITKGTTWNASVICGIISILLLAAAHLFNPWTPVIKLREYGLDLNFFVPLIGFSFFAAAAGLVMFFLLNREKRKFLPKFYRIFPLILSVPAVIQMVLIFVYFFILFFNAFFSVR